MIEKISHIKYSMCFSSYKDQLFFQIFKWSWWTHVMISDVILISDFIFLAFGLADYKQSGPSFPRNWYILPHLSPYPLFLKKVETFNRSWWWEERGTSNPYVCLRQLKSPRSSLCTFLHLSVCFSSSLYSFWLQCKKSPILGKFCLS